jgi:hypothetical protein
LFTVFLGYRVFQLELEVKQVQTNSAIALLSAEAANNKVGAIAPFFAQDKEAFAKFLAGQCQYASRAALS